MAKSDVREIVVRIGIDGLIGKALSLANEDFCSLRLGIHLEEHLQSLVLKLEKLQALLPDAESKAESSNVVLDWLKRMLTVASKADDLLGECAYHVGLLKVKIQNKKRNKVCKFFSSSNPFILRSKITRRIISINLRLERIYVESEALTLRPAEGIDISAVLEETSQIDSTANKSPFLSNYSDLQYIKEWLLSRENEEDLSVISIVGMGGIGKTTLTRQAYRDFDVWSRFDERMWVCVSDDFDVDKILKLMLESLTHTACWLSTIDAKLSKLLERLKGKNYLLVLDDVWNEDFSKWSSLKDYLVKIGGSRGSKIMVTTRFREIGCMMSTDHPFSVRFQTCDECWPMFEQIAFAEGGALRTPQLEEIGKEITKFCQGHPLVLTLLASLMYSKKNVEEWLTIAEGVRRPLTDRSIIDIAPLGFCYSHLPLTLKQCFVYCSIFPKDSNMEREELIQLWMAQGLLNPPKGNQLTMEAVGTKYLDGLLRRNFLQDADEDEDDNRTLCKMHDVLHDFALSTGSCSIIDSEKVKDVTEATHLSLIKCEVEMSETLGNKFAKLRTLRLVDTRDLGEILTYTTLLRVLIVVDWLLEELPSSVGKLKHLTYLDISKTRIVRLPNSIIKLYNLQTLRLYDLEELPKNLENLVSLRHFHVENFKDLGKLNLLPPKFQELINPSSFKASFRACLGRECQIDKLKQLEQPDRYSSLKIYRLENVSDGKEASKANVSSMSKIDSLKLHWNARRENSYDEDVLEGLEPHSNIRNLSIENFKGSRFPAWASRSGQLRHLVKIELEDCSFCEQIPPLGHLRCLKIVRILGMDSVKSIGTEFYGLTDLDEAASSNGSSSVGTAAFPALREFCLKGMASLEEWSEALHMPRAFPFLEKLEVEQCPELTSLPDTFNSGCKHLRRLDIALCKKLTCLPEVLGRLEFLEDLEIRSLPSISQMSIGHCDRLKSLTLGGFFSASEHFYQIPHASTSRSSLHLKGGCGKSVPLPEQVQNLSNLRYLTIWGYSGLETLPEWLGNLRSLQILKLELCGNLLYLPSSEALRQLTGLMELNICLCPLLEERCIRGSRPEWHKISHIPTIKMSYETIQSPN